MLFNIILSCGTPGAYTLGQIGQGIGDAMENSITFPAFYLVDLS